MLILKQVGNLLVGDDGWTYWRDFGQNAGWDANLQLTTATVVRLASYLMCGCRQMWHSEILRNLVGMLNTALSLFTTISSFFLFCNLLKGII